MTFSTWIPHFILEEIVGPSNFKEDMEISGYIGLRKWGWDLKKRIGIIMYLEGFTPKSKLKACHKG
jgi:hypothetical protein